VGIALRNNATVGTDF